MDKKLIEKNIIQFVIQVNGKKKGTLKVNKNISEKEIIEKIKSENSLKKIFLDNNVNKTYFVKNRLINFLIS